MSQPVPRQKTRPSLCAKVAAHEARHQAGVKKLRRGFLGWLPFHKNAGVSITIDDYGRLHADVAVIAMLGWDLPDLGLRVQQAVHQGILRITERPIGEINVTIAGVNVDKRFAPTEEELTP